jgi:hypothetical protein
MFTTHYNGDDDINTIYKLLMAEPNARTQLARTVSITKQMIRTVIHSRARWDEYIPLWQVIKLQARYNSPLFASHGIDHSIRTAYYMQKIWPKCTPPMMWTALLHDVGYSEYDICRNCQRRIEQIHPYVCSNGCNTPSGIRPEYYRANKFLHAHLGANMVASVLKQYPRLFSKSDAEMIVNAIRVHNADSHSDQLYQPRLHGTLLTIGHRDIRRQYIPINFFTNRCGALLRIADNMDITRARLTREKKLSAIVLYQREINKNPSSDRLELWRQLIAEHGVSGNSATVTSIKENTTEHEFKFTYSLWILKKLYFERIDFGKSIFNLVVEIQTTKIKELMFDNNIRIGLYQFKRMYNAFKSIWIKLRPLSEIVRVFIREKWYTLKELSEY